MFSKETAALLASGAGAFVLYRVCHTYFPVSDTAPPDAHLGEGMLLTASIFLIGAGLIGIFSPDYYTSRKRHEDD